ncbi:MAG: hypothetical protein SF187_22110 [Deltaproteobacteria bacterium]|nr:hypothetical protein [Deltaproteobacteria bacterium]
MFSLRLHKFLTALAALVAAGPGGVATAWLYQMFAGRVRFPVDLEWMEGGVLVHALRLSQGQPIYVPPSVDFIPFLYTPGYPRLLAWLSHVFPLGYTLGRVVSVAAFSLTLACGVALAVWPLRREARDDVWWARGVAAAMALGAAGFIASSFTFTGTFYDLVRSDSLMICLVTFAMSLAFVGRGWPSAAAAGALVALAFLTKQTASLMGIALGVALLAVAWRRALVYGGVAAFVLAAGLGYLQWQSGGWFWTYVFELHQSHAFNQRLAFVETPVRLLRFAGPLYAALAVSVVGLALGKRLQRYDLVPLLLAIAGVVASCVGFGTQWAFDNAFIPAVVFPALATATLAARLVSVAPTRVGAAAVSLCVAACIGYGTVKQGMPDKNALVPSSVDRRAARRMIATIAALPGDGFIPFHPYYAVLAGKKPYVHRMGVMDVAAKLGRPAGLDETLAQGKFNFVVLDWKSRPYEWTALETRYFVAKDMTEGIDSVRMFSGAQTSPRHLLLPLRPSSQLPAGARLLYDFESGDFDGWQTEGAAFGSAPGAATPTTFGRFAASSLSNGSAAVGILRSPPFVVTGTALRFWLEGSRDARLRVTLLVGPEVVRSASPGEQGQWITWQTDDLIGQSAVMMVQDDSPAAGLTIDDVQTLGAP